MQYKLILIAAAITTATLSARSEPITFTTTLGRPVLIADQKQTTYLKVGLTGFNGRFMERRTPVNIAIVLDRSGSMAGEKLRKAKEAAIMAIDRLNNDDIVSVIAYDDMVRVLVPATKVSDKSAIAAAINRLTSGNSTALFAGVSKGAQEVHKFLDKSRANRVILLSDGIANVGPSSPTELGDLGASLIKEGISVTTIGLGADFNEDLMTQLARMSDGNHGFAENAEDLARIFNSEFGDVLSVVAQEVMVRIRCADGVRPVRALGRDADITGRVVTLSMNQLYSDQQKYVLLEVEVPASADGRSRDIATVDISYANMSTHESDRLHRAVSARFASSQGEVAQNENADVMAAAIELIAVENNKRALVLRDAGKTEEARQLLLDNSSFLNENAVKYKSESLRSYSTLNSRDATNIDRMGDWPMSRKLMRRDQYQRGQQQSY
jgi:Ca-activated chloride channel family protein